MGETIYIRTEDSIALEDGRKPYDVDIPAYVYDLWMPLIGSDVIGFYGVLCRLSRGNDLMERGKGLSIADFEEATQKDRKTIAKFLQILSAMRFLRYRPPMSEAERRAGVRTKIRVLDAPTKVTNADIKFAMDKDWTPKRKNWKYKPLTDWLIKKPQPEPETEWLDVRFEDDEEQEENSPSQEDLSPSAEEISPDVDPIGSFNSSKEELIGQKKSDPPKKKPPTLTGKDIAEEEKPKKKKKADVDLALYSKAATWVYNNQKSKGALSDKQLRDLELPNLYIDPVKNVPVENGPSVNKLFEDKAYIIWLNEDMLPFLRKSKGAHLENTKWYKPTPSDLIAHMRQLARFYEWYGKNQHRFENNEAPEVNERVW